ncbi:putative inorganic phosphate cotransporter isoform X2 [Harpegnathos saltator]|uniref:Putative inorganic phosphate cotransporter n=1 Tax=Harpegnathos saltator TaxID=610380 RepID=E2BGX2_HARSA|nr:putative inorganic phosphate cotransporter isoform X2 [Harpegnathos saltator]EFN85104.1 Putative inorganic phosphate cotransporter [Harpegnathos saltator]
MAIGIGKKDEDVESSGKASRKTSTVAENPAGSSYNLGTRHLQTLLMFLGMTLGYCQRVGMSVAIVPMINASTANPDFEDYKWDNTEKSLALSSFFWGYTVAQVPSGYVAGIWSAQMLLSVGMLLCGIFNVITPFVTHRWNLVAVCVCRVGMGLTQGCLLPCVHTLLSKWAPPPERARLGTFAYAGAQFGTVIALPISGALAASAGGWPSIFYLFGALAILWSVCFFLLGADSPFKHRSISQEEKEYIEESLRTTERKEDPKVKQKLRTPWREIFTSWPMWAIILAHCGQNWGYWTLLTEMPTYMKKVLNFNIEGSGGYSALPYLAMWILSFPVSWLSDFALEKGASRGLVRKLSNTMAFWGPAIALACMSVIPRNNSTYALALLIVAVGLNAGSLCGFQVNHIDLSPNYAGTMMSITNCIASVVAILAPLICDQIIITDETNVHQWNNVFYVSAAIYFLGNLAFVIFSKGEVQWWNDPDEVEARRQKRRRKNDMIETQT